MHSLLSNPAVATPSLPAASPRSSPPDIPSSLAAQPDPAAAAAAVPWTESKGRHRRASSLKIPPLLLFSDASDDCRSCRSCDVAGDNCDDADDCPLPVSCGGWGTSTFSDGGDSRRSDLDGDDSSSIASSEESVAFTSHYQNYLYRPVRFSGESETRSGKVPGRYVNPANMFAIAGQWREINPLDSDVTGTISDGDVEHPQRKPASDGGLAGDAISSRRTPRSAGRRLADDDDDDVARRQRSADYWSHLRRHENALSTPPLNYHTSRQENGISAARAPSLAGDEGNGRIQKRRVSGTSPVIAPSHTIAGTSYAFAGSSHTIAGTSYAFAGSSHTLAGLHPSRGLTVEIPDPPSSVSSDSPRSSGKSPSSARQVTSYPPPTAARPKTSCGRISSSCGKSNVSKSSSSGSSSVGGSSSSRGPKSVGARPKIPPLTLEPVNQSLVPMTPTPGAKTPITRETGHFLPRPKTAELPRRAERSVFLGLSDFEEVERGGNREVVTEVTTVITSFNEATRTLQHQLSHRSEPALNELATVDDESKFNKAVARFCDDLKSGGKVADSEDSSSQLTENHTDFRGVVTGSLGALMQWVTSR